MVNRTFSIRPMQRVDLDLAVAWAAAEGWNPGLHDADCFYAADPSGFFLGWLGDEPMGCISAVKYGQSFGFIGLYIVEPAYRGHGFGLQLWQTAIAALAGRTIGLDGVVAQQDNYRRSGFQLAYRHIRYAGTNADEGWPDVGQSDIDLIELSKVPLAEVVAYDRPFFPADRQSFLQSWLNQPEGAALGIRRNGQLVGYGVIRSCYTGYKIGPLFADDANLAETLFLALRTRAKPGATLYLDVPDTNPAARHLAECHNMAIVFETARMYTHSRPMLPDDRTFGVTTLELG